MIDIESPFRREGGCVGIVLLLPLVSLLVFVGVLFSLDHITTRRGRVIRAMVTVANGAFMLWAVNAVQTTDKSKWVEMQNRNMEKCVVRVEGREYRPIIVILPSRGNSVGTMVLASGEKLKFLGGVIGEGCETSY